MKKVSGRPSNSTISVVSANGCMRDAVIATGVGGIVLWEFCGYFFFNDKTFSITVCGTLNERKCSSGVNKMLPHIHFDIL